MRVRVEGSMYFAARIVPQDYMGVCDTLVEKSKPRITRMKILRFGFIRVDSRLKFFWLLHIFRLLALCPRIVLVGKADAVRNGRMIVIPEDHKRAWIGISQ